MNARTALNLLVGQVNLAVAASGISPAPTVGIGWPTVTQLGILAQSPNGSVVSIYDRGVASNATRWHPDAILETNTSPGITTLISATTIDPSDFITITVGGTVISNDAISFNAALGKVQNGWVAVATATDTAASMATKLAGMISSPWVTASAAGGVITITNISSGVLVVGSFVANMGVRLIDAARLLRHIQVIIWTSNAANRDTVANAIVSQLVLTKRYFGTQAPNGEWARINYVGDLFQDEEVSKNVYRRDLLVQLEYSETYQSNVYPVLVPLLTEEVALPDGSVMVVT
jgi:hypothetical protein